MLTTKARTVEVELSRKVLYELDGGDRTKTKSLRIEVEPGAVAGLRSCRCRADAAVSAQPSRVMTVLSAPGLEGDRR